MAEYYDDSTFNPDVKPYIDDLAPLTDCRDKCEGSRTCQYMWATLDGQCYLFAIGTTGTITAMANQETLWRSVFNIISVSLLLMNTSKKCVKYFWK
jgi:hypothetical protein